MLSVAKFKQLLELHGRGVGIYYNGEAVTLSYDWDNGPGEPEEDACLFLFTDSRRDVVHTLSDDEPEGIWTAVLPGEVVWDSTKGGALK